MNNDISSLTEKNSQVIPANDDELDYINLHLKDVNIAVSVAMKYIYTIQGWTMVNLEKKFTGISPTTWRRYFQPSYKKNRPLHTVAAYSWLTMVPMPSFYYGLKIKEKYRGMDEASVEAMIHCGILPVQQFQLVLDHIYQYISEEDKVKVDIFTDDLKSSYGILSDYSDEHFMFPATLDMELFAKDYYRSVALAFREFRLTNNLSVDVLAKVLNMTNYAYRRCEDPDNVFLLPVEIAARLKLGFKLTDAMPFTKHMKNFRQFHTLRKVQHLRETLLVEMLRYIHPSHKQDFVGIIKNISSIYTRSNFK